MSGCGQAWRKPVESISDRAKRYRAHSPGCRPNGPKVCALCGSKRYIVVDHADGDESNWRPSNLRYLCKSCNTAEGAAMAKSGKGVRTRQFNPAGPGFLGVRFANLASLAPNRKRNPGAERLRIGGRAYEVVRARTPADHRAGGRLVVAEQMEDNGLTRDLVVTARGGDAWRAYENNAGRRWLGARVDAGLLSNPPETGAASLGEYLSALAILNGEMPGDFQAARRTIHNTPPDERSRFASEIWRRRRGRGSARKSRGGGVVPF